MEISKLKIDGKEYVGKFIQSEQFAAFQIKEFDKEPNEDNCLKGIYRHGSKGEEKILKIRFVKGSPVGFRLYNKRNKTKSKTAWHFIKVA